MNMALNFIQWNIRSISRNKADLLYVIQKYNPICLAISETWLKPDSIFNCPNYICLRQDNPKGHDGCALLIRKDIDYSVINSPSHPSFYIVACKLLDYTVISAYIPHPSSRIIKDFWSVLENVPGPYLILGDFNCHHTLWGSHQNNASGRKMLEIMDSLNLCVLNDGRPTRRTAPSQNPSAVDISICSPSLSSLLSWSTLPYSFGSDHLPIILSYSSGFKPRSAPTPLQKFKLTKADWPLFSLTTEDKIKSLPSVSQSNCLQCYNIFCRTLLESAELAIPLKNISANRRPSLPWWDSDCTSLVKDRKAAERAFSSEMTMENY